MSLSDIATLSGILVAWSGLFAGLIKVLIGRSMSDLDRRLATYDERMKTLTESDDRIDADIKAMVADYQRREDALRESAVLTARIDAVGARIDSFVRREDYLHHETILNYKLDALADRLGRALGEK